MRQRSICTGSPPLRVPIACRTTSVVASVRNRTLPSQNTKFTPPAWRLLNPIRCVVSLAGSGMTGLNGPQVEPLNRLCPFWASGEPRAKTPQPPWLLVPGS